MLRWTLHALCFSLLVGCARGSEDDRPVAPTETTAWPPKAAGSYDPSAPRARAPQLAYYELFSNRASFAHWRPGHLYVTDLERERELGVVSEASFSGGVALAVHDGLRLVPLDGTPPLALQDASPHPSSLSPDGRNVAWGDRKGLHLGGYELRPTNVHHASDTPMRWAPTSDAVAMIIEETLTIVGLDDLEVVKLGQQARRFQWSPDGEWIAWEVVQPNDTRDLYLARPDGSDARRLLDDRDLDHWKWSPNSLQLGLLEPGPRRSIVSIAGGAPAVIAEDFAPSQYVPRSRWSPDGEHLAFGCGTGLCIDARQVSQSYGVKGFEFARWWYHWAPDSSAVAFVDTDQLYVATHESVFGPAGEGVGVLAWSSDSTRVAYADDNGVTVADSRTLESVAHLGDFIVGPRGQITWSPDNQYVFIQGSRAEGRERYVFRVPAYGGTVTRVTERESYSFELLPWYGEDPSSH